MREGSSDPKTTAAMRVELRADTPFRATFNAELRVENAGSTGFRLVFPVGP
jgi:hypothetical protein